MPAAPRRDRGPSAGHRPGHRAAPPRRGAAGAPRRPDAGAQRALSGRARRVPAPGGRDRRAPRARSRHQRLPGHPPGDAALGGCGDRRHRRGHRRHLCQRLLRDPPARPPCDPLGGDGLLLLQQHRDRGAPCAGHARSGAGGDHRLRCAPRQRHRGHRRRRRSHPDGELLPGPDLPLQRRRADGRQHGQRAGAGLHPRHGGARADRPALDAAAGGLPAADDLHLRRLRRPSRGRSGPARPGRGRLRLDHPAPGRPG